MAAARGEAGPAGGRKVWSRARVTVRASSVRMAWVPVSGDGGRAAEHPPLMWAGTQ